MSASYSADVWSAGCLLYELLFGDFLFSDPDWTQFFVRVTKDVLPIASDSAAAAMAPYPLVSAFLSYTLVRNSNLRPSISEVVAKFDSLFGAMLHQPSPVPAPVPPPSTDAASAASSWPLCAPSPSERSAFFRSLVPVDFSGGFSGRLHVGCWPPPSPAPPLNLVVLVSTGATAAPCLACHHMCVSLESIQPSAAPTAQSVAEFRSLVKPCLDAMVACLRQGGSCAVCSSSGAGCPGVVLVAAALMCDRGASLLMALRLLRQALVIETPPPAALDLVYAAFNTR